MSDSFKTAELEGPERRAGRVNSAGRVGRKPLSSLLAEQGCCESLPTPAANTTEGGCPPSPGPGVSRAASSGGLKGRSEPLSLACVQPSPPCSLLTAAPGPVFRFPLCEGTPALLSRVTHAPQDASLGAQQ